MQIVIDIPTELYERLMESNADDYDGFIEGELVDFIQKGTPLPKGHGKLIDINDLANLYNENDRLWWSNAMDEINEGVVPTIIEADKESEEQ